MGSSPGLCRLHFAPEGELLASAKECEAQVFLHWFGNTRQQLAQEYLPYDGASTFLALADSKGEVLAAARLIPPGASGLKTLDDVSQPPWGVDGPRAARAAKLDLDSTWDVATIGVRGGVRGPGVHHALALYHGLVLAGRANQVSGFVAIMDEKVRTLLGAIGLEFHPLPGTAAGPYLGSAASTPVYAEFDRLLDNQRVVAPEAHRLVTLGIGLDGVSVPALDHFRLCARPRADVVIVSSTTDAA